MLLLVWIGGYGVGAIRWDMKLVERGLVQALDRCQLGDVLRGKSERLEAAGTVVYGGKWIQCTVFSPLRSP